MSTIECPDCGNVNFATMERCLKCGYLLAEIPPPPPDALLAIVQQNESNRESTRRGLMLIAVVLAAMVIIPFTVNLLTPAPETGIAERIAAHERPLQVHRPESPADKAERDARWRPRPDMGPSGGNSPGFATLGEFDALYNGMSYRSACEIVGGPGELLSSSHMDGVPGVMESVDTEMYMWPGIGAAGANMNAMFQNDRLISKAQFGL